MKETTAQIYKADLRFESKDDALTRLSVFNFEHHHHESRRPFGSVLAINEETLEAKNQVFRHVETDTDIVIIPMAGAIRYSDSLGNDDIIPTGHIRVFAAGDALSYTLENPYGEEPINYLQVWIRPDTLGETGSEQQKFASPGKNKLFPIFSAQQPDQSHDVKADLLKIRSNTKAYLGIFEARQESVYHLTNPENGLFALVLNGAFDFENHQLEKLDGMAISGVSKVAFEALTHNALLLLIETAIK